MDDNKHNNSASSLRDQPQGFFLPDLCQVKAVLFLVLLAELLALVLTLDDSGVSHFSWQGFALKSLFCQWAFLASAACLCQLRPSLSRMPLAWGAASSYGLILLLVAALALLGQWLMAGAALDGRWSPNGDQLLATTLIAAVLAGIALRYFYLAQQLQQRQQAELQARIQALQSRIRPHFLFNSMNIIASLIAVKPQAAERAVEDLSALFRASLNDSNSPMTLADEIELCQSYVRIEQNRLGERLQVEWQLAGVPMSLAMPSLVLQPLLENAIYHGIQNLAQGGKVTVAASYEQGILRLSISNPYNPDLPHRHGNRIALPNIEHRLKALFGERASLTTEQDAGRYSVQLSYPVSLGDQE
ncbi:sensor histidine kinase [Dasania sp. GY-MA-18]|uniref:Sensor histidine kinase n=1 Tax=Dasania phycosphaerae TaxID=2950436 RepID=A0A9J6RKA2_9GAMM|nr:MULTISPECIES: sensor histidine kinase [Dasania]MCR8922487.1 sensor histidine kinase [Dasania sp. GY-MA-18]MCZ0864915.1 sensor histidine kinase [Dasania phycosphaerae]MCZ0868643.1 sensor histidine kinase [Dasania phycosphaerae]